MCEFPIDVTLCGMPQSAPEIGDPSLNQVIVGSGVPVTSTSIITRSSFLMTWA